MHEAIAERRHEQLGGRFLQRCNFHALIKRLME
jgi:hypothetical protein